MECKYYPFLHNYHLHKELIDTLWNVNLIMLIPCCITISELIDTLWNVNVTIAAILAVFTLELIDTLWNVNNTLYGRIYKMGWRN